MATSTYSEIPGVYSESPRPLATLRRTLRTYRYCVAATMMLGLVITLAIVVSVMIGSSLTATQQDPPTDPPANHSLVTLMSLTWPRRDQYWYTLRWQRSRTMTPDDPHKRQYDDDPLNPDDPDGPEWTSPDHSTFPDNDTWNWNQSLVHGSTKEQQKTQVEEELAKRNMSLVPGSASYKHQHTFRKTDPLATTMAKQGYLMDQATTTMKDRMNLTREAATLDSQWVGDLSSSVYCDKGRQRPLPSPCNPASKYRSVDGTCNNLKNPTWGASFTPFRRALPADYGDGVSSLRVASDGGELPSARQVSNTVHKNKLAESHSYTVHTMSWGQFVDHDITLTALSKGSGGRSIPCCSQEVLQQPSLLHPECASIPIPPDDPYYSTYNQTCMEFTRSAPAPKCHFGPREQLNQQTSFLDGSVIYGTSDHQLASLRAYHDGLLLSQVTLDGRELLPPSNDREDGCNVQDQYNYDRFCFISGDTRVNEQILLTILHTVWARQHNLLAITLKDLNPDWNDEILFQEARKIVIAQIQHITYHEYIPSILGPTFMKHLKLSPQMEGNHTTDYDELLHPCIANEFAAAAYRFGHSQIQGLVQKIDGPGKNVEFSQLNSITFHPFPLYDQGHMANLVRGEGTQSAAAVDTFFSTQVTGKLFRGDNKFGLDLVSVNIQRGRDHGIGPYNRWRMYCGLQPASNFSDLAHDMDIGALRSIMNTYRQVDDIDFYTGGLAERPIKDGLVGPTFACLIADQFLRLKHGDRYWYETQDQPQAFSREQLAEVHHTSLSRILCDNVPELGSIQRWPLRNFATGNPRLPCSSQSIPRVDLGPWEEGDL
ncbi:Chorion peroxidase-like 1 [Homarus americanus]|uniref:Chorion peroxidase-like 1 n=1 Tax=Homarus americanus TaxID=6706 RepID=A0A8J5J9K2_HOMAM|nr:Chorion peroxidase-like 1 [Homarus americanus]